MEHMERGRAQHTTRASARLKPLSTQHRVQHGVGQYCITQLSPVRAQAGAVLYTMPLLLCCQHPRVRGRRKEQPETVPPEP